MRGKTFKEIYGLKRAEEVRKELKLGIVKSKSELKLRLICKYCNFSFRTWKRSKKYCSQFCRGRKYREKHKDKIKQFKKNWHWKNKERLSNDKKKYYIEDRERIIKKVGQYYRKNKENVGVYRKKWRPENKIKFDVYKKRWVDENPEKVRELSILYRNKRRLLENSMIHDYTFEQWQNKKQQTNGICPKCSNYIGINKLTLDHIIPISKAPKGFVYTINDIQPLCKKCNCSKHTKIEKYVNDLI